MKEICKQGYHLSLLSMFLWGVFLCVFFLFLLLFIYYSVFSVIYYSVFFGIYNSLFSLIYYSLFSLIYYFLFSIIYYSLFSGIYYSLFSLIYYSLFSLIYYSLFSLIYYSLVAPLFIILFFFRNFPTKEAIDKKKAVLAEKIARGEVVEEKFFGYGMNLNICIKYITCSYYVLLL